MAKKSKLELIMDLADKMFNNKLSKVQGKLSEASDKMEGKLKGFNATQVKIFSKIGDAFDPVKINQMSELFDKVSEQLDFTKEISNTKTALQQMGVGNLEEVSKDVHRLSKVYSEDSLEIVKAANTMTKQIGGTFENNLKILEDGYQKGANLNGDMLDQFKEYSPQIRELGLDASQTLAIMANANKQGIFSDKAIDSIKEANLSLKEMGTAQVEALAGIGLSVKDLAGKTSFEAVQMISKSMEGATAQAKQLALTDIFKGAGEDAGMAFILGLGDMELDPSKIDSFKKADEGINTWIANLQSSIAEGMGNWAPAIEAIGSGAGTINEITGLFSGFIGVLDKLGITQKIVTGAQWLWNAAMTANPIGIIIVAIAALIGIIVLAIQKWDEWGAALMVFLGPIGLVVSAFKSVYDHWESIKLAFQTDGIIAGIKRIGFVLLDALLKPLQQVLELAAKIDPTGLAQKGLDKIKQFRELNSLVTPGEKEARKLSNSATDKAPNSPLLKAPVIDGKLAPDGKKKKQGEDVSRVAGSANQIRKIDIRIDSFNKGGINVAQSAYEGMTKDDIEAWFKEMMRRVIINAETV
ncbi:phage tail tape measure protein [Flavobacterium sp. B183]|uniref:phage tail tape measure protein n=1 Tax=Flavobacterium sp. B183 TaxID=907046 RepID=UPI00201F4B12|nr:phage tail tape measure protein [Flavobacterium sp. B183]URC13958.1 phage tail tape measure protein [Flavobacterium sp. B183]URC14021.1 phage tail tape measure protein [Flavobacterium sp. B183]